MAASGYADPGCWVLGADGVALAAEVDDWNAATKATTFTLDQDVTLSGSRALIASAPITIDLNHHKLTLKSYDNWIKSDVTFKNGTIEFATDAVGSGIFVIGSWDIVSVPSAKLTLENVQLTGNGYKTGYAAFQIGKNGEVEIKNSSIDLKNDLQKDSGGVFKSDSDANGRLSIIDSIVTLDDAVCGIQGCNVTIKNSTFTAQNMNKNVFNSGGTQLKMAMTIDNSRVTLQNGSGAGMKLGGDSYIQLINGSTLDVGPHTEAAFVARDGFEGKIELQGKGNTLAVDVPFDAMKAYVIYSEDNYEFTENTEEAFTISPKEEEVPVASSASVPKTGDNSQLGLWFMLLLLSGAAIAVAMKNQPRGSSK